MYLIDANIVLEVLYKRSRWRESYKFLNRVKKGDITAYILRFTVHGISAILGEPSLVARFLAEISSWRGLLVADLSIEEELEAVRISEDLGLDFDDALQYYFAKKKDIPIVSFDKDFDKTDIKRLEPSQIKIE